LIVGACREQRQGREISSSIKKRSLWCAVQQPFITPWVYGGDPNDDSNDASNNAWDGCVIDLGKTMAAFAAQRLSLEKLTRAVAQTTSGARHNGHPSGHLTETQNFGSNPGALRMFTYVPPHISAECALVVVLHGCSQNAASYDRGAGWSTLADRYGFALLLPEQQRGNNPSGCFNWFQSGDIERGHGEALSIRQMVDEMVSEHGIDSARVFVTGLSAGGAMASVMLATYPDVFAGGAIVAGLPYGGAGNAQQAFESMFQCRPRSARAWGDLVRAASPHEGPWPRVSVWHGGADATVIPSNAGEIVKQWTDVHDLSSKPIEEIVDGYPRQVWRNAAGDELIESYRIPSMAHGTPLAVGEGSDQCGVAGAFLLDVGISSSYHIVKFWGLAGVPRPVAVKERKPAPIPSELHASELHAIAARAKGEKGLADSGRVSVLRSLPVDIGAVITNALKAAGLMKAT
jgi:poly(hydroxyalkanoate) depolymerase family esterase